MRYWVFAVLTGIALVVSGCSVIEQATNSVEQGECVRQDGEDFTEVGCAAPEADFVVLKKLGSGEYSCKNVAGVTYTYYEDSTQICLGDKGADPTQAVNAAQQGDCVTESSDRARKLPCTDPAAVYKVLDRQEGGLANFACDSVTGTEVTYTWELKTVGTSTMPKLGPDLIFCLAHKEVDTTRALENAEAGDCLRPTTITPNLEIADCGGRDAKYRILKVAASSAQCANVAGATSSFTYTPGGIPIPRVFCVADL